MSRSTPGIFPRLHSQFREAELSTTRWRSNWEINFVKDIVLRIFNPIIDTRELESTPAILRF